VSEPTNTMTMEITMATMGRLMKNFDMDYRFIGLQLVDFWFIEA
jgi:hypothetical protein